MLSDLLRFNLSAFSDGITITSTDSSPRNGKSISGIFLVNSELAGVQSRTEGMLDGKCKKCFG